MIKGLTLHSNNKMSIILIRNTESQHYTKHIEI